MGAGGLARLAWTLRSLRMTRDSYCERRALRTGLQQSTKCSRKHLQWPRYGQINFSLNQTKRKLTVWLLRGFRFVVVTTTRLINALDMLRKVVHWFVVPTCHDRSPYCELPSNGASLSVSSWMWRNHNTASFCCQTCWKRYLLVKHNFRIFQLWHYNKDYLRTIRITYVNNQAFSPILRFQGQQN